ncbi:KAT8 regulatory NSL complex subunit 3 isoform X1 [Pelobates cultripes]|uniref:KAT8 regulatory NSL complex subunit 3 isoform X1 n=1 Tax=Pelobates cultripes TaxID=61616 RepID=A0AAD1RNE8_PELCU|nr:KAT8 regulatory NSL complex subunit 3 isoform X1 [Pelobates cultripes]
MRSLLEDEIADFLTGVLTRSEGHTGSDPRDLDAEKKKKSREFLRRDLSLDLSERNSRPASPAARFPASPSGSEDLSSSPASSPKTKLTTIPTPHKPGQTTVPLKAQLQRPGTPVNPKQSQAQFAAFLKQNMLVRKSLTTGSPSCVFVPVSSESSEASEKDDSRGQLKRPPSPGSTAGLKPSKRAKIKVTIVSHGDAAGGGTSTSQDVTKSTSATVQSTMGSKDLTSLLTTPKLGLETAPSSSSHAAIITSSSTGASASSLLQGLSFSLQDIGGKSPALPNTSSATVSSTQTMTVKAPGSIQGLASITTGAGTILRTIPVVTSSSLVASSGGKPTSIHQLLTNGGLAKLASSLPGLAQLSSPAAGLKAPTTITVTLRGQPSRVTSLSQAGMGASQTKQEDGTHQIAIDSSSSCTVSASKLLPPSVTEQCKASATNDRTANDKSLSIVRAMTPPAVTTSPPKTLYVMSDAKLSALTKSVGSDLASLPLKPMTLQGSSGVPPGAVTFTTPSLTNTPNPTCTVVLSKIGPVLQAPQKTVILAKAEAGEKTSGNHVMGAVESLGRVPSVIDEGSTILHSRESLVNRQLLQPTLIALSGTSSMLHNTGTSNNQKLQ